MSVQYVWTEDVENVCNKLALNCKELSRYHKKVHLVNARWASFFIIPGIVLNCIVAVISSTLQPYLSQEYISNIVTILSLFLAIMGALRVYFAYSDTADLEYDAVRKFEDIEHTILSTMMLDRDNRGVSGIDFMHAQQELYRAAVANSKLVFSKLPNFLLDSLPRPILSANSSTSEELDPLSPVRVNSDFVL